MTPPQKVRRMLHQKRKVDPGSRRLLMEEGRGKESPNMTSVQETKKSVS